jgi:hypothetical protein
MLKNSSRLFPKALPNGRVFSSKIRPWNGLTGRSWQEWGRDIGMAAYLVCLSLVCGKISKKFYIKTTIFALPVLLFPAVEAINFSRRQRRCLYSLYIGTSWLNFKRRLRSLYLSCVIANHPGHIKNHPGHIKNFIFYFYFVGVWKWYDMIWYRESVSRLNCQERNGRR